MFLQKDMKEKSLFKLKKKKSSHSLKHLVYKNWSDKFKTQQVIYKFKLNNTQKPCTVSHYTCRTIYCETHKQITSINTRFNITIISLLYVFFCFFSFFPFCCRQTALIHIPNSSSKACQILQCKKG